MSTNTHHVEITFDDGVYAKLICPPEGCQPVGTCGSCGREVDDNETPRCYDCPTPGEIDECWVKGWFDNCSATDLLHGKLTVAIRPDWDGDAMVAHVMTTEEAAT